MSSQSLLKHIDSRGVATLTLNRPEIHNAFDDVMIADLTEELLSLDTDHSVRVVILKANGKSFSAGADLKWMQRMAKYSLSENHADALCLAELMRVLNELTKPTIALVQGPALGGGVGLVACCDVSIAVENSYFALPEVRLGLIPAAISPYVMGAIGTHAMRRYAITGERFNAGTALRLGLIHEIVSQDRMESVCEEIIESLLKGGPKAQRELKHLLREVHNHALDEKLSVFTAEHIARVRTSTEGKEGVMAFLEKRTPNWLRG